MSSHSDQTSNPGPVRAAPINELPLFRPEVVQSQGTQWLGSVMLEPKRYQSILVVLGAIGCVALVLFIVFGSYTSKVRIRGWLIPERGLARIAAPQAGVVAQILAREGVVVREGTPLLVLSAELRSEARGGSREEAVRQLALRKTSLVEAKSRQESLARQQRQDLERRLAILETEYAHMEKEISFQRARVKILQETVERERRMRARDLISITRLQRTEQESLETASRLENTERSKQALQREQVQLRAQLTELPERTHLQLAELDRNISALDQELADAESKRELTLVAPSDGTVTAIQAQAGSAVQVGAPLLTLVPLGSPLIAQMFASSRGTGFVRPGQTVRLRYKAYPYQKFGYHEGRVLSVSRAAISPSELSSQLSGLSSMFPANEPIYQVTVELKKQQVLAYGENIALQPGMEVEADILVETRRLIEWVFEPLWSITGGFAQ